MLQPGRILSTKSKLLNHMSPSILFFHFSFNYEFTFKNNLVYTHLVVNHYTFPSNIIAEYIICDYNFQNREILKSIIWELMKILLVKRFKFRKQVNKLFVKIYKSKSILLLTNIELWYPAECFVTLLFVEIQVSWTVLTEPSTLPGAGDTAVQKGPVIKRFLEASEERFLISYRRASVSLPSHEPEKHWAWDLQLCGTTRGARGVRLNWPERTAESRERNLLWLFSCWIKPILIHL